VYGIKMGIILRLVLVLGTIAFVARAWKIPSMLTTKAVEVRQHRTVAAALGGLMLTTLGGVPASHAMVLSGEVRLVEGIVAAPDNRDQALYITAREDRGVWQDRVRNFKSPPVMSKRIPASALKSGFPLEVTLDSAVDSTPEGQADAWTKGTNPLLVSARLDVDGTAATRSPEDLTGSGSASFDRAEGRWEHFEIALSGRGQIYRYSS
jgi:hypothetical protein